MGEFLGAVLVICGLAVIAYAERNRIDVQRARMWVRERASVRMVIIAAVILFFLLWWAMS